MKPHLSVILPAYNEEHNLRTGVLDSVYDYLSKQSYTWEILFVDDGSTDNTAKLAEGFAAKHKNFFVLKESHRGKAGTVIAGMLKATGEVVLFTDTDQATPIDQVEKFLPKFNEGYDIVIGSRSGRKGANLVRKVMAYGFMVLRTIILRLPFRDTQCGFKAFKRGVVRPIFEKMMIFKSGVEKGSAVTAGFDLEILYIARKLGYKIAEISVEWEEKGSRGNFGVNPIKDSWEGLRDLLRVRLNALQGKYKV